MFSNIYREMKFECETCNKVFYKRYNYNRHLGRKKPCQPKINYSISFQNIPKPSNSFQKLEAKIEQKVKEKLAEIGEEKNQENKFECEYCKRSYKQKYNLNKHFKKCKEKLKQEEEIAEFTKKMKEGLEKQAKDEEELEKKLQRLLEERKFGGGTTNITNISGDQHNNIINITLNDYGSEDMMRLDPKKTYKKILGKILNSGIYGIQKYIQYKYCNPTHPQNFTIKYTNKNNKNLMIRKDNDWIPRNKHEIINELYERDNNVEEVLKAYEQVNDINEIEDTMDNIQERFLEDIMPFYEENIDEQSIKEMNQIKKNTLNNFYNCYKKHKNTYENIVPKTNQNQGITIER